MPIRERISGAAVRQQRARDEKGRHPLLKVGSLHYGLWEIIKREGNPSGGITSAHLREKFPNYHPQLMADLQKNLLVTKRGKIGSNWLYIADESGKGIIPQILHVEVEFYETDTGAFVTRTYLRGRQDEPGKIVRYLGSRKITFDVPGFFSPGVRPVSDDLPYDQEPNQAELVKSKRARPRDNVIIDAEVNVADHGNGPSGWALSAQPYDPSKDKGEIIDL